MSEFDLPIVDIAPFLDGDPQARAQVARAFGAAFETTGFAIVTGHGVPEDLARRLYDTMTAFFDQPMERKTVFTPPEKAKGRGYLPIGIESVAKTLSGETPPDLCEALVYAAPHRPENDATNYWPDDPPALAGLVRAWTGEINTLSRHLARLSALALDLPEEYFDADYADPSLTLRFVNYPDQPEAPKPGQLRYGEHHDYGALTILRQDAAPGGLEIRDDTGVWREAPVVPDSFVINVGDLLARWTNNRWRSTLHRVSNPPRDLTGSTRRLSMVAFTGPNERTQISCLPSCQSAENPPLYQPVACGDYVLSKIRASHELSEAD
ncbi:isopenicillin N synthase family dioxygenase [Celeribacter indicus]|uniref:2-oxoglutarate-dependent ethylene/succinate-forming enzyme n=1 Tax=Celeribacter indicus TaxID=1208324 RepID=A0A0B5E0C1_9RHOB|nr:2-oxoglutarate and iron-dependent oxygenase domain-containing protein [Celeribacter indicus]AJE46860.1 2OG-Fe(II) oxygenase [Celeribacter indicus]SDW80084.1 Isopenicillin N synthase [Celeribacter indicus]